MAAERIVYLGIHVMAITNDPLG